MVRRARPARRRRSGSAWTEAHVRRLHWRAGFGATPDEAERWARAGREASLRHVLAGGDGGLRGPEPSADGAPLDRTNELGHDVLWWLDRMVRTPHPLEERMTLFWHDHFATRDQDTPLMLAQNATLREHALGTFPGLLRAVTLDPAMQVFLSIADSDRRAPNENYARELMELFTLGRGFTETDVREAARALTGFRTIRRDGRVVGVRYDESAHDSDPKRILGRSGPLGWEDVLRIVVAHRRHPGFLVGRLWDQFVPTRLDARTRSSLARTYVRSGHRIRPVVRRILGHPALYRNLDAPELVKSPVVYVAGMLRTTGAGVQRAAWAQLLTEMGQRPFRPPSVAGWDGGPAWMSTNAMRVRFAAVNELLRDGAVAAVAKGSVPVGLEPAEHLRRARRATGHPWSSRRTDAALRRLAADLLALPAGDDAGRARNAEATQRALRHLLLSGPDSHLC